jgi:hypothetical protein
MKLTGKQIEEIRQKRPATHELGGVFQLDVNGHVTQVQMSAGGKCRDAAGKLLEGVKNCSVLHKNGLAVWHTHPRANRPSSSDLRNAVLAYPKRRHNFVFTPNGVWAYRPTEALKSTMDFLDAAGQRRLVKEWRFLGHMHQTRTQQGTCAPFLDVLIQNGFVAKYMAYPANGAAVEPALEWASE